MIAKELTLRINSASALKNVRSPAETEADARKWAAENHQKADDAIEYLRRIVSQYPIHAALLGDVGERFGIPKPVSAFFKAFCDDIQFVPSTQSRNGSPAVILRGKLQDNQYWAGFKRRGLTPSSERGDINPWAVLGIDGATTQFNEQRVLIFEAFLIANYGAGNLRDMAAVCTDFKRQTGVSFSAFFNGLRPGELQEHPLAARRLNWSWSTSTPPCLSCAAKIRYAPPEGDVVAVKDYLVEELLPFAATRMPDYGINFEVIAQQRGTNPQTVMVSYLAALKQAFQAKILSDAPKNKASSLTGLAQIYRKARFAAEQAQLALDAANSVIKAIEQIAPAAVR